jgi:hypothetical protein
MPTVPALLVSLDEISVLCCNSCMPVQGSSGSVVAWITTGQCPALNGLTRQPLGISSGANSKMWLAVYFDGSSCMPCGMAAAGGFSPLHIPHVLCLLSPQTAAVQLHSILDELFTTKVTRSCMKWALSACTACHAALAHWQLYAQSGRDCTASSLLHVHQFDG